MNRWPETCYLIDKCLVTGAGRLSMDNLELLEEKYKEFTHNLSAWIPDGVTHVDLELLHKYDLLHYHQADSTTFGLTRYFRVIETHEKITLVNEQFVIWIVPELYKRRLITYTLIATNSDKGPKPEMAFATSGVYNNSKLVLRVLEKILVEIQENNELIHYLSSDIKRA